MKVEKKQSQPSILDKAKKLAISKAVDQYAAVLPFCSISKAVYYVQSHAVY